VYFVFCTVHYCAKTSNMLLPNSNAILAFCVHTNFSLYLCVCGGGGLWCVFVFLCVRVVCACGVWCGEWCGVWCEVFMCMVCVM